jgi:N-acetylneuraminic acid mutarotase
MPTERWGLSTCVVDGKIYAIGGGQDTSGKFLSTLEVYDPVTDTWTKKADMPAERAVYGAASAVNGKIYVIGGSPRAYTDTPTVEEYDPATDTWTKKADMPTSRCFLSTCVVDGKIYAIGGWMYLGESNVLSVEVYDPATDTWTKKADMPTGRCFLSTSAVDGKIYVIGGVIGRPGVSSGISTVEEYDPATDTWTKKADIPTGRKAFSTSVVDRKIYAIGGATGTTAVFSTVEVYDPATDTWTRKADMPTARCVHSTSAVNGSIYSIGGSVKAAWWIPTATVEVYDTGFVPPKPTSVNAKGKLTTTWGEIKSSR